MATQELNFDEESFWRMTMRKLYVIYNIHLEKRDSSSNNDEEYTPQGERMVKADELPWL